MSKSARVKMKPEYERAGRAEGERESGERTFRGQRGKGREGGLGGRGVMGVGGRRSRRQRRMEVGGKEVQRQSGDGMEVQGAYGEVEGGWGGREGMGFREKEIQKGGRWGK